MTACKRGPVRFVGRTHQVWSNVVEFLLVRFGSLVPCWFGAIVGDRCRMLSVLRRFGAFLREACTRARANVLLGGVDPSLSIWAVVQTCSNNCCCCLCLFTTAVLGVVSQPAAPMIPNDFMALASMHVFLIFNPQKDRPSYIIQVSLGTKSLVRALLQGSFPRRL